MPVICGATRIQPVYVGDVARCGRWSPTDAPAGGVYELGGPQVWTFRELLAWMLAETRRHRPLVAIPPALAKLQATILERIPGKPLTRDQLAMLLGGQRGPPGAAGLPTLGIVPTPVELVVPAYLARYRPAAVAERCRLYRPDRTSIGQCGRSSRQSGRALQLWRQIAALNGSRYVSFGSRWSPFARRRFSWPEREPTVRWPNACCNSSPAAAPARKARCRRPPPGFRRDLPRLRHAAGRAQSSRCSPVRRAVLLGPLPALQQHPRLAEADRGGPAGGGLRGQLGDQQLPRDLRPHLPAGPALRGQLRHREGLRERHHRRGRALHHRQRVGAGLGQADPPRQELASRSASSAPVPAGWRRPSSCAAAATRCMSMTATTASAA